MGVTFTHCVSRRGDCCCCRSLPPRRSWFSRLRPPHTTCWPRHTAQPDHDLLQRLPLPTGSKDSRRTAFLGFMYDQGLVTLGTGDSLTFPNDVVRLLVNETILENKRVRVRRGLKQAWLFISEPVLGRIKGLLAPSAGP